MMKILVADDEHSICQAFSEFLELEGYTALVASTGMDALEMLRKDTPDMVFLDFQMPGMTGLETLGKIREDYPDLPVVIMTAYGTMHTAIEAVRLGAFDYMGKPLELSQIRGLLQRALHKAEVQPSAIEPITPDSATGVQELVGQSAAMQELFKLIGLLTTNDLNVLITGESGTGKELVAQAIRVHGSRKDLPFVAVNCAAIPENLIESELFGHEKGAFTGAEARRVGRLEAAGEGIIFLDEISELPYHLQSKLLRVLQEKSFERVGAVNPTPLKARVIAASNKDLQKEVEQDRFREDLYHRLNLVTLRLPPLRDRREDIGLLARHFLYRAGIELGKDIREIEPSAILRLESHHWPGNVRELEHTIKRAVLMAHGPVLSVHDIQLDGDSNALPPGSGDLPAGDLVLAARAALHAAVASPDEVSSSLFHHLVSIVEQAVIDEALRLNGDNQVAASRLLGLHRTTLRKKLAEKDGDSQSE